MRLCGSVICALLLGSEGSIGETPAQPWRQHVIAQGFVSQTAVAADFTGDGKVDVVASDITGKSEKLMLFAAPSWTPTMLFEGIRTIYAVAFDVNKDGRMDVIAARYHPGLVFWLEQPKSALTDKWQYHVIDDAADGGADGVHGLLLGDIDRDGNLDLAGSSGQPSGPMKDSLVWYTVPKGAAANQRWPRYAFAAGDAPGLSHYVAFGDVNGDGRPDIASAAKDSPGGNWFAWWEQGKDPRKPWTRHYIAEQQTGATNIQILDVNGDGRPDFIGSRGHGAGLAWFEAPDWNAHEIDTALKGPHALVIGDVDSDGKPDIITVAKDSRKAVWFAGDGKGNFVPHPISEDQSAYDVRFVDMDSDGDSDVLVAGFESKNVVWYENPFGRKGRR